MEEKIYTPISDSIKILMEKDPVAGNELLRLNFKHVAQELKLPANPEEALKQRKLNLKNKKRK